MIRSYILVNQHNNVINWALNQLNMLLFIKIKAHGKLLARGGTKVFMGGDSKFFGWGGTGLDGGGLPLHGGGSSPIPPIFGSPGYYDTSPYCIISLC